MLLEDSEISLIVALWPLEILVRVWSSVMLNCLLRNVRVRSLENEMPLDLPKNLTITSWSSPCTLLLWFWISMKGSFIETAPVDCSKVLVNDHSLPFVELAQICGTTSNPKVHFPLLSAAAESSSPVVFVSFL